MTHHLSASNSAIRRMTGSGFCTMGAQPLAETDGDVGDSGVVVTLMVGKRCASDNRRSGSVCRRGNCTVASRAQDVANAFAKSSSSANKSRALSIMRRGSIITMSASSDKKSVSSVCSVTSQGSQLSIPSNVWPSERRSHCSRPHGSVPTRVAAMARTSSVSRSSRAGKISTWSMSSVLRWSFTVKCVSRSTSSPHMSMRIGSSIVLGNTSTIAPRRENSPRCSTNVSRRYPSCTSRSHK